MIQTTKTVMVVDNTYYVADFEIAEDFSFAEHLNKLRYPVGVNQPVKSVMLTQNAWLAKDFADDNWQVMESENTIITKFGQDIAKFFESVNVELVKLAINNQS